MKKLKNEDGTVTNIKQTQKGNEDSNMSDEQKKKIKP